MFIIIWEFTVKPDQINVFEQAYGPQGEWAALFKQYPGFIKTELLKDAIVSGRYLTCDYWETEQDYQAFKNAQNGDYIILDKGFESLTMNEKFVGNFLGSP